MTNYDNDPLFSPDFYVEPAEQATPTFAPGQTWSHAPEPHLSGAYDQPTYDAAGYGQPQAPVLLAETPEPYQGYAPDYHAPYAPDPYTEPPGDSTFYGVETQDKENEPEPEPRGRRWSRLGSRRRAAGSEQAPEPWQPTDVHDEQPWSAEPAPMILAQETSPTYHLDPQVDDEEDEEDEEPQPRGKRRRRVRATAPDRSEHAEPWTLPSHPAARPSALLLSPADRAQSESERTWRTASVSAGLVIAATVLTCMWAHSSAASAGQGLASAQASLDAVGGAADSAQATTGLAAALTQREQQISTLLSGAVDDEHLLNTVVMAAPSGVALTGYSTDQTAPCPAPDPFTKAHALTPGASPVGAPSPALGCLTLTGTAPSTIAVDDYVHALAGNAAQAGGLSGPFLNAVNRDTNGATSFTIAVSYTTAARLHAYASIVGDPSTAGSTLNGDQ